jgi:hypothetical protein
MNVPLCFVLMPFGKKPSSIGSTIDFDAIYQNLIAPAINESGLEPLRADEEMTGGIIHKPMFERLIPCEYAVADLTTANAMFFMSWEYVMLYARGAQCYCLLKRVGSYHLMWHLYELCPTS